MSRPRTRRPRVGSVPARRLDLRIVEDLAGRGPSIEWAPIMLLGSMILLVSFLLWWMVAP